MASILFALVSAVDCGAARAQALPDIRTHTANRVPTCATPDALMRLLVERNPQLEPRFNHIAALYKSHGEALHVRWDYAFFQMLLETNYLSFRAGRNRLGDVRSRQNNFAGLGTTGGGVPGESFADVSTGVLAQLQHLVAYSGERVANPAAARTREQQNDIVEQSRALGRQVTFRDLARRWAADRRYGASIASIAERFYGSYCDRKLVADKGDVELRGTPKAGIGSHIQASTRGALVASAGPALLREPRPAERPLGCRVWTASYGGAKSVLIRTYIGSEVHYTALQVLDGFESSLSASFIRAHAPGGTAIGEFATREGALVRAFDLCPTAQQKVP